MALDDCVDRIAVQRHQGAELQRVPFLQLPHFHLMAGPDIGPHPNRLEEIARCDAGDGVRLTVLDQDVRRVVLAVVHPLGQLADQNRGVLLGQQPGVYARALDVDRLQEWQSGRPPVGAAYRGQTQVDRIAFRLAADKSVDDVQHQTLHLRRMVHPQLALGGV